MSVLSLYVLRRSAKMLYAQYSIRCKWVQRSNVCHDVTCVIVLGCGGVYPAKTSLLKEYKVRSRERAAKGRERSWRLT